MSVSVPQSTLTVEEYLGGEESSQIRHEYLVGYVYAMTGASDEHNTIAGNVFTRIRTHLRGGPCRAFISDMKVWVESMNRFYYPDVLVTCDAQDSDRYYKTHPSLIIEVSSPNTAQTDRREKWLAYQTLDSLREYVLIAQDKMSVVCFRRDEAGRWWEDTIHPSDSVNLASVGLRISVAEIYEDVRLDLSGIEKEGP